MKITRSALHGLPVLATVGVLALVLAGCGSSSSTPAAGGSSGPGTNIAATLKNYSITLASMPTKAGTYTFNVTNKGPSSHNLTINGPGVSNQTTGTFGASDGTKTLTVTLKNGTYDFYCSVPGHKQLGMNVQVMIGSGSSSTGGGTTTGGSSSSGGSWS